MRETGNYFEENKKNQIGEPSRVSGWVAAASATGCMCIGRRRTRPLTRLGCALVMVLYWRGESPRRGISGSS